LNEFLFSTERFPKHAASAKDKIDSIVW